MDKNGSKRHYVRSQSGIGYNLRTWQKKILKPLPEDPFPTKSIDFGKRRQVQNDRISERLTKIIKVNANNVKEDKTGASVSERLTKIINVYTNIVKEDKKEE